ncbi:heme exporter protein CcmD [Vannielia litorea]|nr:heme exporter protein CcmD [Vannielia litorea]MBY6047106.1 heme exporter protein CcmD [Vannielia litorea]MBY6074520.1 heme exporter protein CcmD [Vannielia litorea]
MPELGKYAGEVLAAYGGSIAILGGLVWLSIRNGAKVRARLRAMEEARK